MWIVLAFLSALFAGVTSILSKIGVENINSNLATAIRTFVVLIMAWLIVIFTGSLEGIGGISYKTLFFLIISGIATGASWLCYFRAIQLGNVSKVSVIDKTSTIMAILLAFIILKESISFNGVIGIIVIGVGTYMMTVTKKESIENTSGKSWIIYAFGSAIFAALTGILGKIGIENIDSNLGTAIRTLVVLIISIGIVVFKKNYKEIKSIGKKSWVFLTLSGIATGASWLCYYRALQIGSASVVVPIDKLSIVVTVVFSSLVLKEKVSIKSWIGLILIVVGTFLLI